ALLLLVWFLFLSAFRWRTRILTLIALALVLFGFNRLVRIDGSANGSGQPRLAWKWAPKNSGEIKSSVAAAPPSAKAGGALKAAVAYPGLLGNDRSGVVQGVQLERDWASHPPEQLWRQPVGLGWSGFAVVDSSAITQEQRGENELVVCYELATGRTLWLHTNHVRFSEKMGGDGPRSTPTIFNHRVYALGATGILDCLDLSDGKLLWTHDTLKEIKQPNLVFGMSCSPLVIDDLVIVSGGETNGPMLWAYHQNDGSTAWKSGTDNSSYSSPTLTTLCGKRQILSVNASSLTAHNPTNGIILWKYDWKGWGPRCAQPVTLAGDRVFISAGFGVGCVLLQIKDAAAGQLSADELWKNLRLKTQFASPLARGNFAYGLDEGVLACIDLATGERKWKDGHYGFGQVVMIDDLLLVQTEPGNVVLVEANSNEFRELGRLNALSSKTWNIPAVAGEFFLTRNDQEAVCYRLPLRVPHPIN
ncbi:MAG: outer membrane protein assembly factor BamB, partial [Pedosphaera sp.]|nr:outer membrane protein assembly factor BamB [Pedosphaera sp.]